MEIIKTPNRSPMSLILSFISPLRIWLNSCATTPWSSDLLSLWRHPLVTATTALPGSVPAAKALIASSSSINQMPGTGKPEAIAISSTTLTSRRSSASLVCGSICLAPRSLATTAPPPLSCMVLNRLPVPMTPPVPSAVAVNTPGIQGFTVIPV